MLNWCAGSLTIAFHCAIDRVVRLKSNWKFQKSNFVWDLAKLESVEAATAFVLGLLKACTVSQLASEVYCKFEGWKGTRRCRNKLRQFPHARCASNRSADSKSCPCWVFVCCYARECCEWIHRCDRCYCLTREDFQGMRRYLLGWSGRFSQNSKHPASKVNLLICPGP